MRIVSLLPSATELVCALGLQQNLVGRSHECDWPLGLRNLPVLTQPKMNPMARAATIDNDVRRLVEHGVSVYMLDADKLADLAPDVIVTQSQCELCAVSLDEVEAALNDWMGSYRVPPKLVSLEPMTLDDVMMDIRNLSVALKCEARGEALIKEMSLGFKNLAEAVSGEERKSVFFMEWTAPIMGAGNWMPEIISYGGGDVVLGESGHHSPTVVWDDIHAADPDVIIVGPCGFDVERAREELRSFTDNSSWQSLRALQNGEVYIANGNHFYNRPGPRLLESAIIIAEILNPNCVPKINNPERWQKW
ncbi:MAG: cobalamin-binding protein [Pseudomonadota bacterium]|nr:cobalamin-binding protein [Pseudomonadota bacterium]